MEPLRETEVEDLRSKEEIHQLLEITKENNEILHGMRTRERIGNILRVMYVLFIVASFYGAYVFAEPYIKQVKEGLSAASQVQSAVNSKVTGIGINPDQVAQIKEVLNNLTKKQ